MAKWLRVASHGGRGALQQVTAIEFDDELAARAMASFAQTPHVRAVHGDGTRVTFEPDLGPYQGGQIQTQRGYRSRRAGR